MFTVTAMQSEEKLVDFLTHSNDSSDNEALYLGGVVFDNPSVYETDIPYNISYKLR